MHKTNKTCDVNQKQLHMFPDYIEQLAEIHFQLTIKIRENDFAANSKESQIDNLSKLCTLAYTSEA